MVGDWIVVEWVLGDVYGDNCGIGECGVGGVDESWKQEGGVDCGSVYVFFFYFWYVI